MEKARGFTKHIASSFQKKLFLQHQRRQDYGPDHVLDCHPVPDITTEWRGAKRQIEDIIITGTALYREGMTPSNRNNRCRILKKYMAATNLLAPMVNLALPELSKMVDSFQTREYGDNGACLMGKTMFPH